jgi:hypothetical protein
MDTTVFYLNRYPITYPNSPLLWLNRRQPNTLGWYANLITTVNGQWHGYVRFTNAQLAEEFEREFGELVAERVVLH